MRFIGGMFAAFTVVIMWHILGDNVLRWLFSRNDRHQEKLEREARGS